MQPTAKTVQKLSNKIVYRGLDIRSIEWLMLKALYESQFPTNMCNSFQISIRFADWLLVLDKC